MKKLISVLIAILIAFSSISLVSCKQNQNSQSEKKAVYNGTHDYTAPETDKYIVIDGKTDYLIVVPSNADKEENIARSEFVELFRQATGITLSYITDDQNAGKIHTVEGKYISIGRTKMLESANIIVDKMELGNDGGKVVTKDNTVYICGGGYTGTVFAVYNFMKIVFGFEFYYADCYDLNTGVKNVKLNNFAVTDIPDFPVRARPYGTIDYPVGANSDYNINMTKYRMRVSPHYDDITMGVFDEYDNPDSEVSTSHNTMNYIAKDYIVEVEENGQIVQKTMGKAHPKWFSTGGNQICFTARGDEEEFEALAQEFANKIFNSLKIFNPTDYPNKEVIRIAHEDNTEYCQCEKCREVRERYDGHYSAEAIILANRVCELVDAWMKDPKNKDYAREDFCITVSAYKNYSSAPARYNEKTKKYEPIDEMVTMHPMLGVHLSNTLFTYERDLWSSENEEGKRAMDAWADITDKIYYWTYATNFSFYMYYYDALEFFTRDAFAYFANSNARRFAIQAQHNQWGVATTWSNLNAYLYTKLMWDTNFNTEELTNNWFKAMFLDAAPLMREVFDEVRIWYKNNLSGTSMRGDANNKVASADYWPYPLLVRWMNMFDEAIALLQSYSITNERLYKKTVDHINIEWLSPAYIAISLYKGTGVMSDSETTALVNRFKELATRLEIRTRKNVSGYFNTYLPTL